MNNDSAAQQLTDGYAWGDPGQQRCGITHMGEYGRKIVFQLHFPISSQVEGLTEQELKVVAKNVALEIAKTLHLK